MSTLYRVYRPQKFSDLIGQDHVSETLKKAISSDRLTHAYLFHGPRGTGKTTTARLLAKRVNCLKAKKEEACGKCKSCKAFASQQHMDVLEIDAASNRGIDDIRALRERISLAPAMGEYKVYIIDEVHMLTKEAATALLKTLEEPVDRVIFILATTELHKVLPTILSRCQIYRFKRASRDDLRYRLQYILKKEKRSVNEEAMDFIIDRSDGCYRDAESLLGQMLTLHEKEVTRDELAEFLGLPPPELIDRFLMFLVKGESRGAIEAVDKSFESGFDPEHFLKESILLARDGAIALTTGEDNTHSFLKENGASERLPQIMRTLLQALQDLSYVPQPMIAIHLAVLSLCTTKGEKVRAEVVVQKEEIKSVQASTNKNTNVPIKSSGNFSVDQVKAVWGGLIDSVKSTNPVASTFLRAMEPIEVDDNVITVRARYALHRNFFDNSNNSKLVTDALTGLLGQKVAVKCFLDETNGVNGVSVANQRQDQEKKFEQTVGQVFG
jgi:DNA polymerase-3 subunit gamma/tau